MLRARSQNAARVESPEWKRVNAGGRALHQSRFALDSVWRGIWSHRGPAQPLVRGLLAKPPATAEVVQAVVAARSDPVAGAGTLSSLGGKRRIYTRWYFYSWSMVGEEELDGVWSFSAFLGRELNA